MSKTLTTLFGATCINDSNPITRYFTITNEALVVFFFFFALIGHLLPSRATKSIVSLLQGSVLLSQTFIVLVFWVILARVFFKGKKSPMFYYYMIYRHLVPFLFMLCDLLISRSKMLKYSMGFVLFYTFIYVLILVEYQKNTGKILYKTPFTDFQSKFSF